MGLYATIYLSLELDMLTKLQIFQDIELYEHNQDK